MGMGGDRGEMITLRHFSSFSPRRSHTRSTAATTTMSSTRVQWALQEVIAWGGSAVSLGALWYIFYGNAFAKPAPPRRISVQEMIDGPAAQAAPAAPAAPAGTQGARGGAQAQAQQLR
jgi:hypothetical protein